MKNLFIMDNRESIGGRMIMKNFFKNKNNVIIGLCAVVILMGIGFAAFSQRLEIGDTTVTNSDWNVYIKSAVAGTPVGDATGSAQVVDRQTAKLTANLSSPGDSVTYTITVANDGNIDAVLDLITLSASNSDSVIKYSYSGIEEDEELLAQTETSFTVTIEYDSTKTGTATAEQKQNTLTLDLDYVQKTSGGGSSIGGTNAATMLASKAVTTGDGLYADTYESGRYVYKGADPDNYITFNGEEAGWRIISVEADGTLKIIRNSSIGDYYWDENATNTWSSSTLKTELNETYKGTLSDTSDIQTHDFPVGAVTAGNTDLAAQITAEKSSTWNGDIGLMSVSDYLRANTNTAQCGSYSLNNTNYSTCATTNWIAVALKSSFPWTINAYASASRAVFTVGRGGTVDDDRTGLNTGVAPVLYLSSDITLSGSGTDIEPYEIVS